jgi:coenzyme PQQ precursor peptide PqqA
MADREELAPRAPPSYVPAGARLRQTTWESRMTWKTPKIVEVQVGMEINMYVCATRK